MSPANQESTTRAPVVLIHGLFAHPACFALLRRRLERFGFPVHVFGYRALGRGVLDIAERLGRYVRSVASTHSSDVHLVGHSLGGLIARAYIELLDGGANASSCITIATPNSGLPAANLCLGRIAGQLRPGSMLFQRLEEAGPAPSVRYASIHGRRDLLVNYRSARELNGHARDVNNVVLDGSGHIGLLWASDAANLIARELAASEATDRLAPSSGRPLQGNNGTAPRRRME